MLPDVVTFISDTTEKDDIWCLQQKVRSNGLIQLDLVAESVALLGEDELVQIAHLDDSAHKMADRCGLHWV